MKPKKATQAIVTPQPLPDPTQESIVLALFDEKGRPIYGSTPQYDEAVDRDPDHPFNEDEELASMLASEGAENIPTLFPERLVEVWFAIGFNIAAGESAVVDVSLYKDDDVFHHPRMSYNNPLTSGDTVIMQMPVNFIVPPGWNYTIWPQVFGTEATEAIIEKVTEVPLG